MWHICTWKAQISLRDDEGMMSKSTIFQSCQDRASWVGDDDIDDDENDAYDDYDDDGDDG